MKKTEEFLVQKGKFSYSQIASLSKNDLVKLLEEYAKMQSIGFAKWHDKTDSLREKPTRWTELYNNFNNGHIF